MRNLATRTALIGGSKKEDFCTPVVGCLLDGSVSDISGKHGFTNTGVTFVEDNPFGAGYSGNFGTGRILIINEDDIGDLPYGHDPYTVAAFLKLEKDASSVSGFCFWGEKGGGTGLCNGFNFSWSYTTLLNWWYAADVTWTTPTINDQQWHSIVVSGTYINRIAWFDGVNLGTKTSYKAKNTSKSIATLGNGANDITGNSRAWHGNISNIAIYDFVFTESQVAQFHAGGIKGVKPQ